MALSRRITTVTKETEVQSTFNKDDQHIGGLSRRKRPSVEAKQSNINDVFSKDAAQKQYDEATAKTKDLKSRISAYPSTVKKKYQSADKQMEMGRIGNRWMEGKASKKDLLRLGQLDKEITTIEKSIQNNPYEAKAVAQLLPYMKNAMSRGGKNYLLGFMVGGGAAAIAGNIGPQALLPEELATVPLAGHAAGSAFAMLGVAEDMRKIEGGNAYVQLLREGVDPKIAKWAGRSYGLASAGLEVAQLKLLGKLIPGAKDIAPKLLKRAVDKVVSQRIAKSTLAKAVGKQVFVAGGEGTVEATQQFTENVIATLAKEYQDYAQKSNISPEGIKEQWEALSNGVAESFVQTGVGVGILGLPSIGVNVAVDTVASRKEAKTLEDRRLRSIEQIEEE